MLTSAEPGSELLKSQIKEQAKKLGFDLCGVTTAVPPTYHSEYLKWLDEGLAGEMSYLHRQAARRADLHEVLPGAKSIIAVGWNYYTKSDEVRDGGVIARYARFPDYHAELWNRLEQLLSFVCFTSPGVHGKIYADTGPITERDYAMRAGLGWIGKHTNLINRRLGNWFFLGEVIIDLELPADVAEKTHCGTCSRCIPACPTAAITAPYKLDARRCISYLTIELKGSIPVDLRPLIGGRIYGCDDCLAVCPWNKFAVDSKDPAVQPLSNLSKPDLCELLALTEADFKTRFKSSPVLRTKRRGLLRNVCVALGNVGDRSSLPSLERAKMDTEPLIREHAEWAINQINRRIESC